MSGNRVPGGVVHTLPADLRAALLANSTALAAWKDITPLARNEFICWVDDAKQDKTRERRIRRTQEELEEGHAQAVLLARMQAPRAQRQGLKQRVTAPRIPEASSTSAMIARHDVGVTTDIRVLDSEGDLVAAANVFRAAMIGFPRLAGLEAEQIARLLEPGRTIGAFADDRLVGTADAVTSTLTLPGGSRVGHAAVTHIGVLPSYTRRGIATELIRHQLHDIAARGEPVATLRASEATIYERYGYGVATSSQTVEVQTARAALRPGLATGGPVRLLEPAQVWDELPRIYAENRPSRPGTIDRPDVWWHSMRLRTESAPGPSYVAVHGSAGAETGFARYRPIDTDKWFVSDQRTIVVEDFFAPDIESYLGLLRFLLDLDLIDRVVFFMLPVDDPLPWLLRDRRAAKPTATHDETWLRIVDVEKDIGSKAIRRR